MKCLIIESNELHSKELVDKLTEYNHEVSAVGNYIEAVHWFPIDSDEKPDLILCEEHPLFEFHSWDFSLFLMTRMPTYKPYMVALTTTPSRLDKAICEEHGIDIYSQKPIFLSNLIEWVQQAKVKASHNYDDLLLQNTVLFCDKESPADAEAKNRYAKK